MVFALATVALILDGLFEDASHLGPVRRAFPDLGPRGLAVGGWFYLLWAFLAVAYIVVLWLRVLRGIGPNSTLRTCGRTLFTLSVVAMVRILLYMLSYSSGMAH